MTSQLVWFILGNCSGALLLSILLAIADHVSRLRRARVLRRDIETVNRRWAPPPYPPVRDRNGFDVFYDGELDD
jgi:hypothetical protein